jgi:4-amino-4-deoxy-L-arabinose transferase-like glycosyltransferase
MTSLDESSPLAIRAGASQRAAWALAWIKSAAGTAPWAICLITAAAAALRFAELEDVVPNHFYDAAVRSMSLSWHNFFFGAFDPGARLAIDKPPLDLWLQVLSVKVFGWNAAALKLPEALGGTLSVPLLYDAVRRLLGRPAGLAAAAALAVLPESVLTSRSDTMDSVMMLLVIAAMWFTIRSAMTGRRRQVILAGVMLGLAFNVKLLEALIGVPALLLLYALGSPLTWRRKLEDVLLAAGAFLATALSWAVIVSLAPGKNPWPVGSTDGSVWNAMFVFNGFGRVSNAPLHQAGGPGLLRLFQPSPWLFDLLIGSVLIPALAIGGAATILTLARRVKHREQEARPLQRAFAVSLFLWIVAGVYVFDSVAVLHSRYLEAVAPAFAAAIGYGAASLAGLGRWRSSDAMPSVLAIAAALAAICAYTFSFKPWSIAWGAVALSVAAVGGALIGRSPGRLGKVGKWLTVGLVVATAVVFPVHESLKLVASRTSNSTGLLVYSQATESALWRYLGPRTTGTRYELAVDEPLALAPLIIHDQRPILPLTSWQGRPLVKLPELRAAVQAGDVRYALVGNYYCSRATASWAACTTAARWIRHNGIDVTKAVGLPRKSAQRLYLLRPL